MRDKYVDNANKFLVEDVEINSRNIAKFIVETFLRKIKDTDLTELDNTIQENFSVSVLGDDNRGVLEDTISNVKDIVDDLLQHVNMIQ